MQERYFQEKTGLSPHNLWLTTLTGNVVLKFSNTVIFFATDMVFQSVC